MSTICETFFKGVKVKRLDDEGNSVNVYNKPVVVQLEYDPKGMLVKITEESEQKEFIVCKGSEFARVGRKGIIFKLSTETLLLTFASDEDSNQFTDAVMKIKADKSASVFSERTEESSASQYFQFYGYLSQQQNMMQDFIRTSTYQKAILDNPIDFSGKVILDVGAGSGILSFFAQQSGAKRVYAVEASSIAVHAAKLVAANNVDDVIKVLSGKIEEIQLPEQVDVIISEPMGYMLLNERMLETFLHAKKFLKPGGKMFPSRGELYVAPFTDEALYMEQFNQAKFWATQDFHGVNLSSLRNPAMTEYFSHPIVDTIDINICTAKTQRHIIDFQTALKKDLHRIEIPLEFHMLHSGTVHGLAFWWEVALIGSNVTVMLSTAPTLEWPGTNWEQVRCLLSEPIFAKEGQLLTGRVLMVANAKESYDVTITVQIEGTNTVSTNTLDLSSPIYRSESSEREAFSSAPFQKFFSSSPIYRSRQMQTDWTWLGPVGVWVAGAGCIAAAVLLGLLNAGWLGK
eukprot:GFUD01110898.1.p1 GENE.GFUD01110898.1~~GFUD01110898.1.p1  ORF type:complete len:515 (-),score=147.44 GFUD01110898.1:178-1722(-)